MPCTGQIGSVQSGVHHRPRSLEPPAAPREPMQVQHLLQGDLRGGGDSEVELLPVKWEQHFRKDKALVSFVSSGGCLGWCGLPSRRAGHFRASVKRVCVSAPPGSWAAAPGGWCLLCRV